MRISVSQVSSVLSLLRKAAAESFVSLSTMCSTGFPSRNIMSMQTVRLNTTSLSGRETRKQCGA